jgi:hypothetical protein
MAADISGALARSIVGDLSDDVERLIMADD